MKRRPIVDDAHFLAPSHASHSRISVGGHASRGRLLGRAHDTDNTTVDRERADAAGQSNI